MLPSGSSVLEILDNKAKDYKYMIISNNKEIEFYKANGWDYSSIVNDNEKCKKYLRYLKSFYHTIEVEFGNDC